MIMFNKNSESNSQRKQAYALLCALLTLALATASVSAVQAQNQGHWNQFRGPHGDGKSLAKDLPVEFSEKKNLRWKTPIHDKGWSSPVVWGQQIWLTTGHADGSELFAICVDLDTGQIVHDIKVFAVANPQLEYQEMNLNTHATPTPIVEAGRVYVHYTVSDEGFAACLEAKTGKQVWRQRLRAGGDHWACPVYANGKIYFCGKKGVVSVIAAARDFQLCAENHLDASFIASPAVAGDALILRSTTHLYCIAE